MEMTEADILLSLQLASLANEHGRTRYTTKTLVLNFVNASPTPPVTPPRNNSGGNSSAR